MARTEEEWEDRFGGAVEGPEGTMRSQSAADREFVTRSADPLTVWSVYEADNENLYLLPGFHAVNVIGHVIAEKPRTPEEEASGEWAEVLWVDHERDFGPGA